jgi:hypothetical protein
MLLSFSWLIMQLKMFAIADLIENKKKST